MATSRPAFSLTLGSTTLTSSVAAGGGGDLVGAAVGAVTDALGGGGAAAAGAVVVGVEVDSDLDAPGTLDAWLGIAADVSVSPGEAVELELGYADSLSTAFVGSVTSVEPDLVGLHVRAVTDESKLLQLRLNQVYENQAAGQIVSDLASQAGVSTGTVQNGFDLPFYVVDDSRSAYRHCRELAERTGFDLYVSADGELTFAGFDRGSADHTFGYARDVLSLSVTTAPPRFEAVEVWGESPASSEGAEAASWLVRDFSGSVGTAGSGPLLRVSDPAVRTGDAAATSAQGRLAALTRRATFGTAVVLGAPDVQLGDAVTFEDVPDARLEGVFQVRRVRHTLTRGEGFTTRLELLGSGSGGGLL
jgi:phage protein D